MSSYLKPQSPLYHKTEDAYFYPLTTADQVILKDGGRLNTEIAKLVSFSVDNAAIGKPNPINADTLGGFPPEHYLNNTPKAGFIYPLAASTVPDGFLLCDGAEYLRAEYPELFAAIGTMYGEGNGSTTFNVPNLQTRVPVGKGEGYALGDVGGEAEHTLTVDEIPSHRHEMRDGVNNIGMYMGVDGTYTGTEFAGFSNSIAPLVQTQYHLTNVGGSQSHNNMQPYTVVNYIIATGKKTGVNITDIIMGAQAIPLGVEFGGTNATSPEMARKNLEITPDNIGALSMELLWENASPDSVFSEQDVVISGLQDYSAWIIVFSPFAGANPIFTNFVMKTTSIRLFAVSSGNTYDRGSSISGNTISFWNGFYNGTEDAKYTVPTHIYGIKGGI